jgi:hypothetical protein
MARAEYSQNKSVAMILYRNQSVIAYLPPVDVLWRWSDAVDAVGAGVLQRLEGAGLVQRVHGGWWSATEELAGHLRKNHSVELTGSPGIGQRVLNVPSRPGASRSDESDSTAARVTSGQQVTLDGNNADTRSLADPDISVWGAQQAIDPAEVEGQMRLDEISKWLPAQQTSSDDQTVKNDETTRIIICRKCGDRRHPSDPDDDECEICLHCDQPHSGDMPMGNMPRTPANTKTIYEQVEEDFDGKLSSLFSTTSTEGED